MTSALVDHPAFPPTIPGEPPRSQPGDEGGIMLLVKLIPNLGWLVVGRAPKQVLAMSLLLAAPLTLVIAIADLAGRLGMIDTAFQAALVLAGMLVSLVFPSLARRLLPTAQVSGL